MAVEIGNQPVAGSSPAFAGLALHVPLTEAPDEAWRRHFATQDLPGRAHRLDNSTLVFYLDRDHRDVGAAMTKIAQAIQEANDALANASSERATAESQAEQQIADATRKVDRQLQAWWENRSARSS